MLEALGAKPVGVIVTRPPPPLASLASRRESVCAMDQPHRRQNKSPALAGLLSVQEEGSGPQPVLRLGTSQGDAQRDDGGSPGLIRQSDVVMTA